MFCSRSFLLLPLSFFLLTACGDPAATVVDVGGVDVAADRVGA